MTVDGTPEELLARRDPAYVRRTLPVLGAIMRTYFRSEVRDMDRVPDGGALIVSNHSGGWMAMDVPILATAFHDTFGHDRPLYTLAHDLLFTGLAREPFLKFGFVPATRENARAVLRSGAVTIVFPGGDRESFRPTSMANTIDFDGRTGYVRTALETGVPIVPAVSIGGQEAQLFLTRGEAIGRFSPLRRVVRSDMLPLTFGFPFGLTAVFPPNLPLPTKITTQVLEPVDLVAEFGRDPDVDEVDAEIRRRMQAALDELAAERRFPVIG